MRQVTISALAIALLVTPAALAAGTKAQVRVLHASPDAPPVDVLVNDTIPAFTMVGFGEITEFATLDANVYNTKVVPAGAPPSSAVIDADLNLFYKTRYTVVATDFLNNITPLVLNDRTMPASQGWTGLRFVHASPDAPAVDIKVANGPYLFRDVSFQEIGSYVDVPARTYNLEVRLAGTDTVVLALNGISLENRRNYTAYAVGLAGGSPGLQVVLSVDSSGSIITGPTF